MSDVCRASSAHLLGALSVKRADEIVGDARVRIEHQPLDERLSTRHRRRVHLIVTLETELTKVDLQRGAC